LAKSAKHKLDAVRIVGTKPFAPFQPAIDGPPKAARPSAANGKGN
jgi:hypothetical protein